MKCLLRIICSLLIFITIGSRSATVPQDLNTVTIPLTSQAPSELHKTLMVAFSQVLVKISGNSQVINIADIQKQLPLVERYVQQYSYVGPNLQVTFNQKALIALLAQVQQPVWLTPRPPVFVLASTSEGLQEQATKRGITLVFPTADQPMNQADQAAWQAQTNGVILAGKSGDWLMTWHGQTWQWHDEGSGNEIYAKVIDKVADTLSSQLALNLNQAGDQQVWLAIHNINNLLEYHQVLYALKQLPPVLNISVRDVGSHGILVQVSLISDGVQGLKQALSTNQHFVQKIDASASPEVLQYQWLALFGSDPQQRQLLEILG